MSRTPAEAVARAESQLDHKIRYILGAGGRDPNNSSPTTYKNTKLGCDCIGFVCWALGIDRYQPGFPRYDGWMNTDSIINESRLVPDWSGEGPDPWWKRLRYREREVQTGDVVVYPGKFKDGKRVRPGHCGLVTGAGETLATTAVIDCNASLRRRLSGKAVGRTTAAAFDKLGMVFLRYIGPA